MTDLLSRANVNIAIDSLLDDLAPDGSILPSAHNDLLNDILDTLANGLSTILRTSGQTNGENITINGGSQLLFNNVFDGDLQSDILTSGRNWILPDASGTIALLSDITGGDSIYTVSGTVPTSVVATITDSLTFSGGGLIFKGSGTSGNSIVKCQNGSSADLWSFFDNGDLTGSKARVKLIAQNSTPNDLNEYFLKFRNSIDTATYGVLTNTGYFSFGISNSIALTDFTTCFQLGHLNSINSISNYFSTVGYQNSITGSGSYRYIVGKGNDSTGGNEQVVIGVDNAVSGNYGVVVGSECIVSGLDASATGRAHNVAHPFSVVSGSWCQSGASGSSVFGHGVESDKTQKLTNSVANSVAFGWNSVTPKHFLTSTGAIIGGTVKMADLPTSAGATGELWNDAGTLKIA